MSAGSEVAAPPYAIAIPRDAGSELRKNSGACEATSAGLTEGSRDQVKPASSIGNFELTPGRVLRALRRRWIPGVALGILVAAMAGFAADHFVTSTYTARTQVHFPPNAESRGDLTSFQRRQTATVRSRLILGEALQDPNLAGLSIARGGDDAITELEKSLVVDFGASPDLMRIFLKGQSASTLLLLLDAIRESYLREGANKEVTDKTSTIEWLKKLVADDKVKLLAATSKVTELAERFQCPDVSTVRLRNDSHRNHQSNLQSRRFQLEVDRDAHLQAIKEFSSSGAPATSGSVILAADRRNALEAAFEKDEILRSILPGIKLLKEQIKVYEQVKQQGTIPPGLVEKQKLLANAEEARERREATITSEVERRLIEDAKNKKPLTSKSFAEQLHAMKMQSDTFDKKIAALDKELVALEKTILDEIRGINELNQKLSTVTEIEDRLKATRARIEILERELALGNPHRAHTDEVAVITQVPNPSKKSQMVLGAIGLGFLGGLLGVAFLDLRTGRIDSTKGVDRHLQAGVVGWLPRVPQAELQALKPPEPLASSTTQAGLFDAADACRALLMKALDGKLSKVVMVTSAVAGEGKTTLATQLALSLGRAGYRTLLIDADVRRPSVHTVFGRTLSPGLVDVMKKKSPLEKVLRRSPLPMLGILPAGECDPREAVSIMQLRMGSVLRRCKQYFEVIVIDTPPLDLPDGIVIGRHTDGTILSLMNEVSSLPTAQDACSRLRSMNIPILGAVLNAARVHSPRGYY